MCKRISRARFFAYVHVRACVCALLCVCMCVSRNRAPFPGNTCAFVSFLESDEYVFACIIFFVSMATSILFLARLSPPTRRERKKRKSKKVAPLFLYSNARNLVAVERVQNYEEITREPNRTEPKRGFRIDKTECHVSRQDERTILDFWVNKGSRISSKLNRIARGRKIWKFPLPLNSSADRARSRTRIEG